MRPAGAAPEWPATPRGTTLATIDVAAAVHSLAVFGALHPRDGDDAPPGCGTLVLLGPKEPGFWPHFSATAEVADGTADPLDRWSRRVVGALAVAFGAEAVYPFGGPPYAPFLRWAQRSNRAWHSPVGLLVHDTAGLMVSYRGALAFETRLTLPLAQAVSPCTGCARPCVSACPVDALNPDGYDVAACHALLDTPAGADCLSHGCKARRACPVSQTYGRRPSQSGFHMRSFHR